MLGLLWLREEDYLYRHTAFEQLREARSLFATKSVYASFAGYASGQLHRMTSYSPAIQAEIDSLTSELEAAGWHLQDVMDGRSVPMPKGITADEANAKAKRLRELRAKYHAAYMGEKRRRLVVQHGFDVKNAGHLIRLLAMCKEFLATGELNVHRGVVDADMLRDIKAGKWTLDAVKARAEEMCAEVKTARDASPLPDTPNHAAVDRLLVRIVRDNRLHSTTEGNE